MGILAQWSPVTEDFGLIHASVEVASSCYAEWMSSVGRVRSSRVPDLGSALAALPPLSMAMRRKIFVPTRAGWTGFFQSGIQGSDPFPVMSRLTRLLGVDSMRVCVTPEGAVHPACIWEVYAPATRGGVPPLLYRRSISAAAEDGRWSFDQTGEPFPFEDLAAYNARRKRDRFTPALLERYLAHLGLHPFDEEFFAPVTGSQCVLVERVDPPGVSLPEFTLEQVRAELPWRKHEPPG